MSVNLGNNAAERLRSFVDRVERLDEEIKALSDDKSGIFKEARETGFDVKTLKKVIQRRRMDSDKRTEQDELLETYEAALEGRYEAARAPAREESARKPVPQKTKPAPKKAEQSDEAKPVSPPAPPAPGASEDDEDLLDIPPFLKRTNDSQAAE